VDAGFADLTSGEATLVGRHILADRATGLAMASATTAAKAADDAYYR
jgi:hypothetical protein